MDKWLEWVGIGLLITDFDTGRDVFMQGEEGSALHDKLEDCETEEQVQFILSYSVLFEEPTTTTRLNIIE